MSRQKIAGNKQPLVFLLIVKLERLCRELTLKMISQLKQNSLIKQEGLKCVFPIEEKLRNKRIQAKEKQQKNKTYNNVRRTE